MSFAKMQSKEWYEKLYAGRESGLGWNIGKPYPSLIELVKSGGIKPGYALVPGCGLGYDAISLAENGFDVVAFDISANAIRKAQQKAHSKKRLKGRLQFLIEDIYALPKNFNASFDYVVEIGNFQAMSASERREYVSVINRVLNPYGRCVVICKKYPPLTPGPKGLKKNSLVKYFSDGFRVKETKTVLMYRDSPPMDGYILIAEKKP